MFPLAQAAYNAHAKQHGRTDAAMRSFIESHGLTLEDDSHLLRGDLLRPYWEKIEAKLKAAAA